MRNTSVALRHPVSRLAVMVAALVVAAITASAWFAINAVPNEGPTTAELMGYSVADVGWENTGDDASVAITTMLTLVPKNSNFELLSITPLVEPGGSAELLAARISFGESATRIALGGIPGTFCVPSWPFSGFGPTYPFGTIIERGEHADLTIYWRNTGPGATTVSGLRIRFRDSEGEYERTVDSGMRATLLRADAGEEVPCRFDDDDPMFTTPFAGAPG